MTPGIYEGIPIEQYHGTAESISKSGLDAIAKCPALYQAMHLDENRPGRTEKAGQLEGNLAHCAFLEPGEFSKRYAVLPDHAPKRPTPAQWKAVKSNESSDEAKAWWTKWNHEHAGSIVITAEQRYAAMCQAESLRRLPSVFGGMSMAEMLECGQAEVSAYWNDPNTGVLVRCRPDLVVPVNDRQVVLCDVKTYSDASADEFRRQVGRKSYHLQDAVYSEGYWRASGKEVLAFIFLVVEDKWPFLAAHHRLGDDTRNEGMLRYRDLVDTYAECLRSNTWPSYAPGTIDLPPYLLSSQEIEVSYAG